LICKEVASGVLHGFQRKIENREASERTKAGTDLQRIRKTLPANCANTREMPKKKPQPRTVGVGVMVADGRRFNSVFLNEIVIQRSWAGIRENRILR
jgi:hypothetical protein